MTNDEHVLVLSLKMVSEGLPSSRLTTDEAKRLVAIYEAQVAQIRRLKLEIAQLKAGPGETIEEITVLGQRAVVTPTIKFPRIRRPIAFVATCPKCEARYASPGGNKPSGSFCLSCPDQNDPGLLVWEHTPTESL